MTRNRGIRAKKLPKAAAGRSVHTPMKRLCTLLGRALETEFSSPGIPGADREIDESNACAFSITYLFDELLSKFDDGKPNQAKADETWRRFHTAESRCKATNRKLRQRGFDPHWFVISRARNIAEEILGRFDWNECHPYMGWGPGASTRQPRRKADSAYKYSGIPETTFGNATLAHAAIAACLAWRQAIVNYDDRPVDDLTIVPGNRVITVPKSYKVDRTIAIEPCMNMYIQKGIGGVIRRRLLRRGVNLNDQTRNQELAREGALHGNLATIDLSMASDTISSEFVRQFLPLEWWTALEQCRSPLGTLPSGELFAYQKFSSMGNGFTFELESLIFYSLALACVEHLGLEGHHVSVYGDDIIIPVGAYGILCEVLDTCGFTVNGEKSFAHGPFRESCGKHYFHGHDVTPFYVRKPVDSLSRLFLLHNNLWRWRERNKELIGLSRYEAVGSVLTWIRGYAPAEWRKPRLPDCFGDGAFIGFVDEMALTPHKWGWEAWQVKVLAQSTTELECDLPGLMVKSLEKLERLSTSRLAYLSGGRGGGALPSVGGKYREMTISVPLLPPQPKDTLLLDDGLAATIEWEEDI